MADYDFTYLTTNVFSVFVRFVVPNNTNADANTVYGTSGWPKAFVRVFTGHTEADALLNKTPSRGDWITALNDGSTYKHFYQIEFTGPSVDAKKMFARVEAYLPGRSQKGIKYSRKVALASRGYFSDDISLSDSQVASYHSAIIIDLTGVDKMKYVTYGECYDMLKKISYSANIPNFSETLRDQEITIETGNTACTFYNVFRSGNTTSSSYFFLSGKTTADKYKTTSEIATKMYPACDSDGRWGTYDYCGAQYNETDCPEDSCPTNCNRVCNCDEESTCYSDACLQDCNSHVCTNNFENVCKCFSADETPDCKSDDMQVYDCQYGQLACVGAGHAKFQLQEPASALTVRLEGRFLTTGTTRATIFEFMTQRNGSSGDELLRLSTYGLTSGQVRGGVSFSGGTPSVGFTGITYNTDVDITVGNNWIYNNLAGSYCFSGITTTAATQMKKVAMCGFVNFGSFRAKRVRIYKDTNNLIMDLRPYALSCSYNTIFKTEGLLDSISGEFFTKAGDSSECTCASAGLSDGSVIPVDYVEGTGLDCFVNILNAVSGIPIDTTKFRFEGQFVNNSKSNVLFRTCQSNSHSTSVRIELMTSGLSQGRPKAYLSYGNGTNANGYLSGVTVLNDFDLTIGNRYIYNNKNGTYALSGATTTTTNAHTSLFINVGRLAKFYRLRVYNGNALLADFRPGYTVTNGGLLQPSIVNFEGAWDGTGGTMNCGATAITPCFTVTGSSEGSLTLTCMNGTAIYYVKNYNEGDTIDKSAIQDPSMAGGTFTGWNPAIPDIMPNADFTTYAQYTVNQYTIYYYVDGALYTQQTYDYGAQISAPTDPTPPSGYIFSGWDIPYTTMPAFDVNIYATMDVYVPKYTINFYSGSTSWGNTPTCSKFKSLQYQQGATISYPSVSDSCHPFAYGGWKLSCTGGTNAPTTMPATDGLNVYGVIGWKTSTIHWMAKTDGDYVEYSSQTAEYQDTISSGPDLSSYAPSGYEWQGWGTSLPFTMPCEDKYVYGRFIKPTTYYTYTLYADGEVLTQRQLEFGESIPYSGGDSIMNGLPSSSGSCSISWSWPTPDPSTMPSYNLSANTYSVRDTHTLAYYVDGSLWNSYNVTCGSSLLEHALPNNTGYSYSAWNPSVPSTMPDSNVSCFTQSTHIVYHVKYYKNNSLWATDNYYYGDTITPHALPTDVGKTYSDWSPALPSTMPANDISTYSSSAGTQYQMYYYLYNMSGSTSSTLYTTRTFTYQQSVSGLGAPSSVPTGQSFSGWTGEPSTMPANNVYVSGWTIPIQYTISWYSRDGVSNTLIAADNYYYNNTMLIRIAPGSDWVYTPSLIGSNKMPASNVTAYSDLPTACTSDCSADVCLCNGIEEICNIEYCTDCAKDFCNSEGQTDYYMTYNLTANYSDPNTLNIKGIRFKIYLKRNGVTLDTGTHTYTSTSNFTSQSIYETGSLSFPSGQNGMSATLSATISRKNGNAWGTEEAADVYPTTVTLNQYGNIEINAWFVMN